MLLRVQCVCGTEFSVPDTFAGASTKCPDCNTIVLVRRARSRESRASSGSSSTGRKRRPRSAPAGSGQQRQSRVTPQPHRAPEQSANSVGLVHSPWWPLLSRLTAMIPGMLTWSLISARVAAMGQRPGVNDNGLQIALILAIGVGFGMPTFFLLYYGIHFGPEAAAARWRGLKVLLLGLVLGVAGVGCLLAVMYFSMQLGAMVICGGMLVPLAWAMVGVLNILTGVDIIER